MVIITFGLVDKKLLLIVLMLVVELIETISEYIGQGYNNDYFVILENYIVPIIDGIALYYIFKKKHHHQTRKKHKNFIYVCILFLLLAIRSSIIIFFLIL